MEIDDRVVLVHVWIADSVVGRKRFLCRCGWQIVIHGWTGLIVGIRARSFPVSLVGGFRQLCRRGDCHACGRFGVERTLAVSAGRCA